MNGQIQPAGGRRVMSTGFAITLIAVGAVLRFAVGYDGTATFIRRRYREQPPATFVRPVPQDQPPATGDLRVYQDQPPE